MRYFRLLRPGACWAVGLLILGLSPAFAIHNDADRRPFDFSDDFYLANGINPENIVNRVSPDSPDGCCVADDPNDPEHVSPRIILTTGGYDASGANLYYTVTGMIMPNTFTEDEAGQKARELADKFRAILFPKADDEQSKADGCPCPDPQTCPAEPCRRQDNIFDTRDGYFSNNPLGLWILTFASWKDGPNFNTETCQKEHDKLLADNGADLDGTAQIRTASDIDNLADKGCILLRTRPDDGSKGFPWVI